jgi:hypothetical protein
MKADHADTLERVYQLFRACPDPSAREKDGGWSTKEIIGHLVDSASDNHQRLSRYVPQGHLDYPPYDQEQCVQRAGYQAFDFERLLAALVQLQPAAAAPDRRPPRRGPGFDYFDRREAARHAAAAGLRLFCPHGEPRTPGTADHRGMMAT